LQKHYKLLDFFAHSELSNLLHAFFASPKIGWNEVGPFLSIYKWNALARHESVCYSSGDKLTRSFLPLSFYAISLRIKPDEMRSIFSLHIKRIVEIVC
jgi:hypothetical protein